MTRSLPLLGYTETDDIHDTHEPMIHMRNSGSIRVMKKTKHEMEGGWERCYSRKDNQEGPPEEEALC